jgi:hypothetical protein
LISATDRRFKFHKRSQLFISAPNETLSVAAMGVCNPDRAPLQSTAETQPKLLSMSRRVR